MSDYSNPVAALREQVSEMKAQAQNKLRESRELRLVADTIDGQAIRLDLLADRIEREHTAALADPS